jgi:mono/diheme cytochrome c family protein
MRIWIISVLLAALLTACSLQSDKARFIATNPELYEQGEQIYVQTCAACHRIGGEGQYPDATMERDATGCFGAPPHNEKGHTWHHDDDLLYQIVTDGGMGTPEDFYPMPAFGEQLDDDQIVAVIFYIKGFWTEEQRQFQQQVTDAARNQ